MALKPTVSISAILKFLRFDFGQFNMENRPQSIGDANCFLVDIRTSGMPSMFILEDDLGLHLLRCKRGYKGYVKDEEHVYCVWDVFVEWVLLQFLMLDWDDVYRCRR
ncbi:hypothetical protein Tco_0005927 [Tanacetum coccineum]